MVGCCGQRGKDQNQRDKRDKCAPINTNISGNKCVPGTNAGINRGKYVTSQHDEEICHGTGERRRDLLDQLKIFLNEFDDRPCTVTPPQQGPDARRTLGSYPEYLQKHCQSWMPPNPRPPLITSVQTHEIRASSDYDKMKGETSEYLSFTDATLKPPVMTCDCVKRNGLQDQCPHPMCKPPTAQCKANNPGPCCPPSLGLGGPEAVLGGSKGGAEPRVQGQYESTYYNDYRDQMQPMAKGQPQPSPQPQPKPANPSYETTYFHDYRDQLQPMSKGQGQSSPQPTSAKPFHQQLVTGPQHHPLGAGSPHPPPGMKMICICKAPSSALPSGKKYLCCPIPQ